jgi:lysine 2,3-aminomutase
VLGDIGVLPYYTFVLKGYRENQAVYAPIARVVQEELEEKSMGKVKSEFEDEVRALPDDPASAPQQVREICDEHGLPFVATDRSVLNLPAVGKSLTFRTIGITRYGRRILEFDHDTTRAHSPITDTMGKVIVIESKSIGEYLRELDEMGENIAEYRDVWGYSVGQSEPRSPIYEYPPYDFEVTKELSNLELEDAVLATATGVGAAE